MDDDATAVAHLIERIGHLVRSEEQTGDLNPAQWGALRYLSRANRFSRNPMALTRYLGTTRGTTSQTLIALERKGYVRRTPSQRDKRSVDLEITDQGIDKVKNDPVSSLVDAAENALGDDCRTTRDLLSGLLQHLVSLNDGRMFGQCRTCRHFRSDQQAESGEPHLCGLLDVGLSDEDGEKICVEQEGRVSK